MSRLIRDPQLVNARGRKYLATDERRRFLEDAARAPQPADQTFALTLAHIGARVSEALAICPRDVDLEAASIRIRTLKRSAEHWREVPVPPELLRALELVIPWSTCNKSVPRQASRSFRPGSLNVPSA